MTTRERLRSVHSRGNKAETLVEKVRPTRQRKSTPKWKREE